MSSSGGGASGATPSSSSEGGFGLEEIGVPGREYLREALTSCTDPLKAIEDFQVENGILLPSLRPMLPLLDLHGIKRLDFHNSVLEDLRERLIVQLEELNSKNGTEKDSKLKELLIKSFPVIKIKQLRPVVMAVLKHMTTIEDKYLRVLVRDKELYADCDIVIKRHLWRDNQSLFGDEVSPFLRKPIYQGQRNCRRQADVIQKLANMIGSNKCSLLSRELQGFLDAIRRGQVQVLGDLSMTLCDPFAINFLASSAMKILNHQVNNDGLPRENSILHLLLRMLILGLSAWEMINSQEFSEPKLDPNLITKFIPSLMSLIVDDQVRALNSKLPADERESAITIIEHSGPPPEACQIFIEKNFVATTLAMHYALQVARSKDKTGVKRILGLLSNSVKGHPFQDTFMHCLVTSLTMMREDFESEDFCTVVFDEFFFTNITCESYVRHLLRLLWAVYTKINATRLKNLMKLAEPGNVVNNSISSTSSGDPVLKIYCDLSERIEAHNASQAALNAEEDKRTDSII
ncbi:COBRA1 [Lepeophtheirus salmonis]|uniref:COBRA1 n=1 Tax=Lepeophtheirus salmonis TaxID=72036 RepID=A0A7R8CPP3_LEPSM|nr:COBRA1 [Lepeophtheirus salmonis]CAF2888416.1 COBRA1 [Lepeophtheirus salmonis]